MSFSGIDFQVVGSAIRDIHMVLPLFRPMVDELVMTMLVHSETDM